MTDQEKSTRLAAPVSRRTFMAIASAGVAASVPDPALAHKTGPVQASDSESSRGRSAGAVGPFDDFRGFIKAMEARGRVVHIPRADQDAYEATALMYHLVDRHGLENAPIVVFAEVKINGQWVKGPVIGNYIGHADAEALIYGLEPEPGSGAATLRKARQYLMDLAAANGGRYPLMDPAEVPTDKAPCKQVVLRGDDIDLTRFPFLQVNPGDGGRFINTASVFTADQKEGVNFGTYRCELKGPRKVAVASGEGHTGWRMLTAARERGERIAKVALVLGQDPVIYVVSGSRIANRQPGVPIDELALAGGLRGRPVEVARCETSDFLVPASAEMIIEGDVPLNNLEPEGPYGEVFGYQGHGETTWFMNVTAVTHRRNPWFANDFTGVTRNGGTAGGLASSLVFARKLNPEVRDIHYSSRSNNIIYVSIDKTAPGQGIGVGEKLCKFNPVAKVVIVFDKDVDLMDTSQVMFALSSRWQPDPAARIYRDLPALPLDPSLPDRTRNRTSKMVIDATRQWPEEGGPKEFPPTSRSIFMDKAPEALARAEEKWRKIIDGAW